MIYVKPIRTHISEYSQYLSCTVTVVLAGRRRFNLRLRMMMWLLRLAAWVGPINVIIKVSGPENEQ